MNITVENRQFRVEFKYHQAIVARLKLIAGSTFDKPSKCWFVPMQQGDKLMATFPKASFSYDALCACWDAEKRRTEVFALGLRQMGVTLALDDSGTVVAVGEGVAPALQDLVRERSDDLRAWASIEPPQPVVSVSDADVRRPVSVEVTKGDQLIFDGIQNAAKREQEQREMQARMVRRRILEQRELFEGEGYG